MAKRKTRTRRPSTQAQLAALRRDLVDLRAIVTANTATLEAFQKIATSNFRRVAELQAEIDRLKKTLAVA